MAVVLMSGPAARRRDPSSSEPPRPLRPDRTASAKTPRVRPLAPATGLGLEACEPLLKPRTWGRQRASQPREEPLVIELLQVEARDVVMVLAREFVGGVERLG